MLSLWNYQKVQQGLHRVSQGPHRIPTGSSQVLERVPTRSLTECVECDSNLMNDLYNVIRKICLLTSLTYWCTKSNKLAELKSGLAPAILKTKYRLQDKPCSKPGGSFPQYSQSVEYPRKNCKPVKRTFASWDFCFPELLPPLRKGTIVSQGKKSIGCQICFITYYKYHRSSWPRIDHLFLCGRYLARIRHLFFCIAAPLALGPFDPLTPLS